jgi:hypothetical protein
VHATAFELEVVVAGEHVGEGTQALGDMLPAKGLLLLDLKDVHPVSLRRGELRNLAVGKRGCLVGTPP